MLCNGLLYVQYSLREGLFFALREIIAAEIYGCTHIRAVARTLIGGGGGGVYSYIRVMPDGFLLKSVVFKLISKEISRA